MTQCGHVGLTPCERRVLGLLLSGLSHKQVALRLDVARSTVRTHVKHMHAKCDTHSPAELVLWAVKHRDCCL